MTRKYAIHDSEPHVITSHGADFFGQDRHPIKALAGLAPYAENSVSYFDRATIAPLVALLEAPADRTFPADESAQLAGQLLKVARTPRTKPAALARALADAAARAAAVGESWTWTVEGSPATA